MEESGWRLTAGDGPWANEADSSGTINSIRSRIDELDQSICALLSERLSLSGQLREAKEQLGLPVLDSAREEEVLGKVATKHPALSKSLQSIYRSIMAESRKLQAQPAVTSTFSQEEMPVGPSSRLRKTATPYFPRILIVGVGLIGGALCRHIKEKLPQTRLFGVDRPDVLSEALRAGVIDAGETDPVAPIRKTDLIVLSASPEQNLNLLRQIAPHLQHRQLVMDVTSTKSSICRLAESLDLNGSDFVGGHPFFGSEKSGLSASADLDPSGSLFCLVPTAQSSEISLRRLSRWLASLAFDVEVIDAATHDLTAARLSHLVQLLAVAMGAEIAGGVNKAELQRSLKLSGPSFRHLCRLMSSPAPLWMEIFVQNDNALVETLLSFEHRLSQIRQAIENGDTQTIGELFHTAALVPLAMPKA